MAEALCRNITYQENSTPKQPTKDNEG
ncbi:hypothetical protein TNCV_932931 [Trichonephila clavipes]|nr:hypothetical protein TNCV_932931 [Trichonephila clavipes]